MRKRWDTFNNGAWTEEQGEADSIQYYLNSILTKWKCTAIVWINAASHSAVNGFDRAMNV